MGAEIFLTGDSHAVPVGLAARAAGLRVAGGPLGTGVELEAPFFDIRDGRFVLLRPGSGALQSAYDRLLTFEGPILSTLGFNAHRFAASLRAYCDARGAARWQEVMSQQAFRLAVLDARRAALAFYQTLAAQRRQVFFLHSPQIAPLRDLPILRDFETILIEAISSTGARLIDLRDEVCDAQGLLHTTFHDKAHVPHANQRFGALAITRLLALTGRAEHQTAGKP